MPVTRQSPAHAKRKQARAAKEPPASGSKKKKRTTAASPSSGSLRRNLFPSDAPEPASPGGLPAGPPALSPQFPSLSDPGAIQGAYKVPELEQMLDQAGVDRRGLKTKAALTQALIDSAHVPGDIVSLSADQFEHLSDLQVLYVLQQLGLAPERTPLMRRSQARLHILGVTAPSPGTSAAPCLANSASTAPSPPAAPPPTAAPPTCPYGQYPPAANYPALANPYAYPAPTTLPLTTPATVSPPDAAAASLPVPPTPQPAGPNPPIPPSAPTIDLTRSEPPCPAPSAPPNCFTQAPYPPWHPYSLPPFLAAGQPFVYPSTTTPMPQLPVQPPLHPPAPCSLQAPRPTSAYIGSGILPDPSLESGPPVPNQQRLPSPPPREADIPRPAPPPPPPSQQPPASSADEALRAVNRLAALLADHYESGAAATSSGTSGSVDSGTAAKIRKTKPALIDPREYTDPNHLGMLVRRMIDFEIDPSAGLTAFTWSRTNREQVNQIHLLIHSSSSLENYQEGEAMFYSHVSELLNLASKFEVGAQDLHSRRTDQSLRWNETWTDFRKKIRDSSRFWPDPSKMYRLQLEDMMTTALGVGISNSQLKSLQTTTKLRGTFSTGQQSNGDNNGGNPGRAYVRPYPPAYPATVAYNPPRPAPLPSPQAPPPARAIPPAPGRQPRVRSGTRMPTSRAIIGANSPGAVACDQTCYGCNLPPPAPGDGHQGWECPLRFATEHPGRRMPGFDAQGQKIAAAWDGPNITDATRGQWDILRRVHGLFGGANPAPAGRQAAAQ